MEDGFMVTNLEWAINWGRESSLWPMTFGLALRDRDDGDRHRATTSIASAQRSSATPRQSDLMIVAGTVNMKMASRVRRLYNQMPDPKFVIAMGAAPAAAGPITSTATTSSRESTWLYRSMSMSRLPAASGGLEGLMRIQDKVRKMKEYHKGQPVELAHPARTGAVEPGRNRNAGEGVRVPQGEQGEGQAGEVRRIVRHSWYNSGRRCRHANP